MYVAVPIVAVLVIVLLSVLLLCMLRRRQGDIPSEAHFFLDSRVTSASKIILVIE
jgi:hypothetical protein